MSYTIIYKNIILLTMSFNKLTTRLLYVNVSIFFKILYYYFIILLFYYLRFFFSLETNTIIFLFPKILRGNIVKQILFNHNYQFKK